MNKAIDYVRRSKRSVRRFLKRLYQHRNFDQALNHDGQVVKLFDVFAALFEALEFGTRKKGLQVNHVFHDPVDVGTLSALVLALFP
jgi:hypothetical protein